MRRWWLLMLVALVAGGAIWIYYNRIEWLDVILQPSEREVYYRNLPENIANQVEAEWQLAQDLIIELKESTALRLYADSVRASASCYRFTIPYGNTLAAYLIQKDSNWLFSYREQSGFKHIARDSVGFLTKPDRTVDICLQHKYGASGMADLVFQLQPAFSFPVAGKDNKAIRSFWGAARDGGHRSHQGNDIFAVRGTPVVAVGDGRVSSIRDRGLGGKQVWVRDGATNLSLYYAHLDGWNTTQGQRVSAGDTLGFVGNTGNARTTPPHLHFGIYKNGMAIDPKPFIWQQPQVKNNIALPQILLATGTDRAANLRRLPSTKSEVLADIKSDTIQVLGQSQNWYQVRYLDSLSGFVHRSVLRAIQ